MTKYMFIICSALILFYGCNKKAPESESQLFADYLKQNFGRSVKMDDSVKYVLVSDNCCHSCIESVLDNMPGKKNCVIILGKNNALKYRMKCRKSSNILIDSTGDVSRIKYCKDNVAFVDVVRSEICGIAAPEPNEILGFINRTFK